MAFSSPGLTDVQKRISFGSCQERKMFPLHHAPDRLGIQLIAIRGDPLLGPGRYLSQEVSCSVFMLRVFPSQKTHSTGAIGPWPATPVVESPTPAPQPIGQGLQIHLEKETLPPSKRTSTQSSSCPSALREKLEELKGVMSAAHVLLPFL